MALISEGSSLFWERPWLVFALTYPSGAWRLQSVGGSLMNSLEASRAMFLPILLATGFITSAALHARCGGRHSVAVTVATILLILNPIVSEQLDSFYVDKFVYAYGLLLIAMALLPQPALSHVHIALIAAAVLLLIDTKLSGIYYAAPLLAIVGLRHRENSIELIRQLPSGVTGLFILLMFGSVVAFQPYATNIWWTGKLVFPPAEVLLHGQRPTGMRSEGIGATLQSLTIGVPLLAPDEPIRYDPRSFRWIDFHRYSDPGLRVGAFGPLMPALMLVGLGAGLCLYMTSRKPRDIVLVALSVGAICLFFPAGWCARFVPFFWVVPVLVALAAWLVPRFRWLGGMLFSLLAFNAIFVLSGAVTGGIVKYEWFSAVLDDWRLSRATLLVSQHPDVSGRYAEFGAVLSWNDAPSTISRQLQALGIPFRHIREGGPEGCETPPIVFGGTSLCACGVLALTAFKSGFPDRIYLRPRRRAALYAW